jgi:two-component system chemotaxis response regulator CheB
MVFWSKSEGSIIRFRCHTGHAFSLMSLLAEVNEAIDTGLWSTLRAVEERVMLLQRMEKISREAGAVGQADKYKQQAESTTNRLQPIREMVLDPKFFGHGQE